MWKVLIERLDSAAEFSAGTSESHLLAADRRMNVQIPNDLKELLRQSNGVVDQWGVGVIWPIDQIVRDNLAFRNFVDFKDLYMSFDSLLFFADNGGGDHFAYVVQPKRFDIFVWDHEDDSRQWVARSMSQYLTRRLSAVGDEWYRRD